MFLGLVPEIGAEDYMSPSLSGPEGAHLKGGGGGMESFLRQ